MLYWGGQILAFLPGIWLTPQHPDLVTRVIGGWMALMMLCVFALQILWIWQQLRVDVESTAASNSQISRLLVRTQVIGSASLVGFLILAAINFALGDAVAEAIGWLQGISAIVAISLLTSGGLAALCLCKAEIEVTPDAKPSVLGTFVQFFYAGLTAGAIARRARKVVATAEASQLGMGVAV